MRSRVVWVERLGLVEMCILGVRGIFSNLEVRYSHHNITGPAGFVLSILKHLRFSPIFLAIILPTDKRSPSGETLKYKVDDNLRECAERFSKEYVGEEPENLRNMRSCYISSILHSRVAFATSVEEGATVFSGQTGLKHEIWFTSHPLNKMLVTFYKEKGILLRESFYYKEYIKFFMIPPKYMFAILLSKMPIIRVKSNLKRVLPSIWVEHTHNDVVDFTFWAGEVKTDNFDIVCYLDRSDTPASAEITGEIESRGFKWIDAHLISMARYIPLSPAAIINLLRPLFQKGKYPEWFRVFSFENAFWTLYYKSIYDRFRVKVLIQHQDSSWKQELQARAIESAGGIMVGLHWSNYPSIMTPSHLFPFHVFFAWGKLIHDFVQGGTNTCNYILPSGYWLLAGDRKGSEVKIKELSADLNFIIAVFDSSVSDSIHQTPKTLSLFYTRILDMLENNMSLGAIVKSKNWGLDDLRFLECGGEIVSRLKLLVDKKRVIVLNKTASPAEAAVGADLSVCYGLNTAGIVAGIHSARMICWDCSGWTQHPFYEDHNQKFIYKTIEELEGAVIKASEGDNSIGDFSSWNQKFNYFNDFEAPRRVGQFIQTFMDEVVKTDDGSKSLDYAVKTYKKENYLGEVLF